MGAAAAYVHSGNLRGVLENCDKALKYAASDVRKAGAHALRGKAFLANGSEPKHLAQAEAEFRIAISLNAQDPLLHFHLGVTLLRQAKDDEGRQALSEALQLVPPPQIAEQAQRMIADPRRAREVFAPDFHLTTV